MSFLDIDERLIELAHLVEFDRSPITDIKHCCGAKTGCSPVVLHYVGGKVEVELTVDAADFPEREVLSRLAQELAVVAEAMPAVVEIRLNYRIAPN